MTTMQMMPLTPDLENMRVGKTMCPYCGVGCVLDVATRGNKIIDLRGDPDAPANRGLLCPKGALLSPVLDLPGRLLQPQYRNQRTVAFADTTWEDTLGEMARRL